MRDKCWWGGVGKVGGIRKIFFVYSRKSRSNSKEKYPKQGFPGGAVVKNPSANAGDMGSSPGPGRSHMLRSN